MPVVLPASHYEEEVTLTNVRPIEEGHEEEKSDAWQDMAVTFASQLLLRLAMPRHCLWLCNVLVSDFGGLALDIIACRCHDGFGLLKHGMGESTRRTARW